MEIGAPEILLKRSRVNDVCNVNTFPWGKVKKKKLYKGDWSSGDQMNLLSKFNWVG